MLANNGALPMGWRESVKKFLNRIMVDYEEVYAVTVLFSQKTIGELE